MRASFPSRPVLFLLLLVLVITVSGVAHADNDIPVLELLDGDFVLEPSFEQTRYLYDFDNKLTSDLVLEKLDEFVGLQTRYIQFDVDSASSPTIWLHFRVRNATPSDQLWMIDIHRSGLASVQVYRAEISSGKAQMLLDCSGNQCSLGSRLGSFINTILDLDAGKSTDILVAFVNPASEILPVAFATPARFQSMIQRYALVIWTANGAWVALLLVAFLMGRAVGWALTLSYIFYASIGFVMLLSSEGFLSAIANHGTMIRLDQISYHLLFPALLLFCRQFFTTKKNFPVTDTLILTLIIIILVVLPVETLGYFNEFTGLLTNVFSPALAIAIYLITAIRAWKRRISGSAVVFSGAIIMLIAVGSNILSEYVPGFIHRDSVNAITHVAFLFEAILFASAIGIRQLEIRQQRDQALRAELISTRERLRLSEQLQSSRKRFDQAKKQAEARQLKLATLSHDLKQPLISLRRGLSALEIHGDANQRMHAAFDYLESLSQRQLDERPNADNVTTESDVEQFPINAVLDNVIAMFQAEAASKGLDLRYRSCDEKIHADPIEVMRIASNLVSNAIKHVQSGGVLVACRVRSSVVQLQVHDTGRGMSQSELNRCMLAYNRGDSSEGTGLGLHLVASLSHEAGFTFNAESKPGKGSSFSVSFPKA